MTSGGEPRNFSTDPDLEHQYRDALRRGDVDRSHVLYEEVMRALNYHHHMSAVEASEKLGAKRWATLFTFAVDRHPYEKVISMAYWRAYNITLAPHFVPTWIDAIIADGEYCNYQLYMDAGRQVVDRLYKFDELPTMLDELAARFGTTVPAVIPREKSSHRKDRRPAREILSSRQRKAIIDLCAAEFELFGWAE